MSLVSHKCIYVAKLDDANSSAALRAASQESKSLHHEIPCLYRICNEIDKNIHINNLKAIIIIYVTTILISIVPRSNIILSFKTIGIIIIIIAAITTIGFIINYIFIFITS